MQKAKTWMIIAAIMIVIGIAGATMIILHGEEAMGTSDRMPWGAMIAGYEFFVVTSAGLCLVGSLGYIFKIKQFEIVSKRAVAMAIVTLLSGFIIIGMELGNPLNMIYLMLSPNLTAPIMWMGALYSVYLVLMVLQLILMITNKQKLAVATGTVAFLTALAALSNMGGVFALINARPYWNGPYLPVYFLLSAFLSGVVLLSIIFYFVERQGGTVRQVGTHIMPILGKLLAMFLAMMMFFVIWKMISGVYGGVPGKYEAVVAVVVGPLAWKFWIFEVGFGMVIPFVILMLPGGFQSKRIFPAAVLALIGAFFMRYDLVIAGQLVPLKVVGGATDVAYHSFQTGLPAWGVIVGALGVAILLYLLAEQKLPLDYQDNSGFPKKQVGHTAATGI